MEPTTCVEAEPFALRVLDDSMEPEFPRGCIVIVDPTGRARDGAYVLAEQHDALVLRRLRLRGGAARLEALDGRYASADLDDLGALRGVVTQRAGARRREHKRYE